MALSQILQTISEGKTCSLQSYYFICHICYTLHIYPILQLLWSWACVSVVYNIIGYTIINVYCIYRYGSTLFVDCGISAGDIAIVRHQIKLSTHTRIMLTIFMLRRVRLDTNEIAHLIIRLIHTCVKQDSCTIHAKLRPDTASNYWLCSGIIF